MNERLQEIIEKFINNRKINISDYSDNNRCMNFKCSSCPYRVKNGKIDFCLIIEMHISLDNKIDKQSIYPIVNNMILGCLAKKYKKIDI